MKAMDSILMTEEGWERLRYELSVLRGRQGSKVVEYRNTLEGVDPADAISRYLMSDVAWIDRRIAELDEVLSRAVPVDPAERAKGVVGVGSRVKVRWDDGEEDEYVIVGPPEVNFGSNWVSYESPVGRALMGRREGERVGVSTPDGSSQLQIVGVDSSR
jgi:transcription elongation factor GreA